MESTFTQSGFIQSDFVRYDDIVDVVAEDSFPLWNGVDSLLVPCFSNGELGVGSPAIERAVIVIHGTLRNADDYFAHMMEAAETAGAEEYTRVIVPQFLVEADVSEHGLSDLIPFWEYMGWRQGDLSLSTDDHPRDWLISSYAIADSIALRLVLENPNLERVTVIGHSAGGQFANRYAAGNAIHDHLASQFGVDMRYIVCNPSSHLYFDTARWIPGSPYELAPADEGGCAGFNDYKYGLADPNEYMAIGAELLRENYAERTVIYLNGERDDDPYSSWLDVSCPALAQGSNRLQRALIYQEHLQDLFGPEIVYLHHQAIVHGVGHSHGDIFNSNCGLFYLFDHGFWDALDLSPGWLEVSTPGCVYRNGSQAVWTDFDRDGWPDIYLSAGTRYCKMLVNQRDGTFREEQISPLDPYGESIGAVSADFDNDGDADIAVLCETRLRLFRNDISGFTELAGELWNIGPMGRDLDWVDYDNDGDLDAFVCQGPMERNILFRNEGAGAFSRQAESALCFDGFVNSAAWADFDRDGDVDIYLCCSAGANFLFRNDGGHFVDVTDAQTGYDGNTLAACWGDYDNDGDMDLYLSNEIGSNKLLRNDGDGGFWSVTQGPLSNPNRGSRSVVWFDHDNDGRLDLYLANDNGDGRLLRNRGPGVEFEDLGGYPLCNTSSGASVGDYDRDGDLDLYLTNGNYANMLLLNTAGQDAHWLQIRLTGELSNRDGLGACIELTAGGQRQVRQAGLSDSGPWLGTAPQPAFGLGEAAMVDTLRVFWPSGVVQEFTDLTADRVLLIRELGSVATEAEGAAAMAVPQLRSHPNPFNPDTHIIFTLPDPSPVTLSLHDATGRLVAVLLDDANLAAGECRIVWRGRDDTGKALPSGVYFCRLKTEAGSGAAKLVLLK